MTASSLAPIQEDGLVVHNFPGTKSICCESNYVNGKKEGPGKLYYRSGKLYAEETWANDKLNGLTVTYYESGVKQSELPYKDDLLDGSTKEFFPSGTLAREVSYVAGKKNGTTVIYGESGDVKETEDWANDVLQRMVEALPPAPAADAAS